MTQLMQEAVLLSATEGAGERVLPISPFRNEEYLNFTQPADRAAMRAAIREERLRPVASRHARSAASPCRAASA